MEARRDFNAIVEAACERDVGALVELHHVIKAIYQEKIPLDMKDDDGVFTPAGKLASLGNHAAVNLLRAFGANESHIAMGYAAGNYLREAKAILRNTCVDLNTVAIGVGMSADADFKAAMKKEFDLSAEWMMFGAAYAGLEDYAQSLLATLSGNEKIAAFTAIKFGIKIKTGLVDNGSVPPLAIEKPSLGDGKLHNKFSKIYKKCNTTGIPTDATLFTLQHDPLLDLNKVYEWTQHCDQRYSATRLTYEFTFIENEDYLATLAAVIPNSKSCYDDAKSRKRLMRKYHLNYYQLGLLLKHKDIRELLDDENALSTIEKWPPAVWQAVDKEEVVDIINKYNFYKVKENITKQLENFCVQNSGWLNGLLNNPKIGRVESLKIAIQYLTSLREVYDLIVYEYHILIGTEKPAANPLLPKHMQPLDSDNVDFSLVNLLSSLTDDACFKQFSGATKISADVTENVSEAKNSFIADLEAFINEHSTSVMDFNFTGSQEHKIDRVRSMLEASRQAKSREDLIAISLSQFSMFNHLTKPKTHPQSPKHLQPMTTDDVSPEFRLMVDKLLKCEELKPIHFKNKR